MASSQTVQDLNAELARRINEEARNDPDSRYQGKFVGIANGQVVAVGEDLDQVILALRRAEPDAEKTYCLQAGLDESEIHDA
jgi:hypothetical protein